MSRKQLIIGVVAVVVVLAAIGASAGSKNRPAGAVGTQPPAASAAASAGAASQPSSEATAQAAGASYKVGDRVKLGNEEYFGVIQVDPSYAGTSVFKPSSDKVWFAALVQVEGINPTGASYNPFYFKARDDQGFEYNFSAFGMEPTLLSSNDLKPGQIVKGWVTFEVPATTKKLTLVYTPGFFNEPVEIALN